MSTTFDGDATIILESTERGRVVIPQPNRLKRLNYFDGKFLRADDLRAEQDYLRRLVHVSNQAGGSGVVMGLDTTLAGDALRIGPGEAIDGEGRVLLLTEPVKLDLAGLVEASRSVAPGAGAPTGGAARFGPCEVETSSAPATVADGGTLYVVWLGHAEALCGEEDVVGKLCEAACTTSIERPYRLEGVVVRALPLSLTLPPPPAGVVAFHTGHLRSRVASAYYEDEWTRGGSLVSGTGLAQRTWCLGSHPGLGLDVPLAVVAVTGSAPLFLDQWIVRRERLEPPARSYWAGRMAMRPWPVYLAQILQFQCQLADVIAGGGAPGAADPCGEALAEAKRFIASIEADVRGDARKERPGLLERLDHVLQTRPSAGATLVDGGIVATPPAGYLPVRISTTETVNDQVAAWLGDGVDLRCCIVRPDFVAHALEEAQHMERISLLEGLADAARKTRVDVLVPDGQPLDAQLVVAGRGWDTTVGISEAVEEAPDMRGVTRTERVEEGGGALHFAGALDVDLAALEKKAAATAPKVREAVASLADTAPNVTVSDRVRLEERYWPRRATAEVWLTASCLEDVFGLAGGSVPVRAEASVGVTAGPLSAAASGKVFGDLEILQTGPLGTRARQVRVAFTGMAELDLPGGPRIDPVPLKGIEMLLTRSTAAAGVRRLDVELVPPPKSRTDELEQSIGLRVEWSGTPLVATISTLSLENIPRDSEKLGALIARTTLTRQIDVASLGRRLDEAFRGRVTLATAREDAAVLQPGDDRRTRATAAIERLACLLGDEAFVRAALAKLFPAPTLEDAGQRILPTLDWVLFHRRRDKDCGPAPAPPAAPPEPEPATACQEVFRLDDPATIERVQALIQKGALDDARRFLTRLGTVTFAEGSSEVADAGTVAARWGDAPAPVRAWPYWVATDEGAGDAALRRARVRAVAALVGAQEVEIAGGEVDGPLGPCGFWTLLEPRPQAPPATVRHEVHYLRNDSDAGLVEALRKERRVLETIATGELPHEGHAVFRSGDATIVDDESELPPLPFTYEPHGHEVLVFRGPVDVSAEPLEDQAKTIADRLVEGRLADSFDVSVLDAATQEGWPAGAAVIAIVVVTG
jgi:hypothetical protein